MIKLVLYRTSLMRGESIVPKPTSNYKLDVRRIKHRQLMKFLVCQQQNENLIKNNSIHYRCKYAIAI